MLPLIQPEADWKYLWDGKRRYYSNYLVIGFPVKLVEQNKTAIKEIRCEQSAYVPVRDSKWVDRK